ncbi:hypothetical protein ACU5EH_00825 [Aliivibrio salmonicida]|uniref:hypothetical protein n=1 Tax=Aliivibrio salmonicida TaxID=40269 RepID=UPI00406C7A8C
MLSKKSKEIRERLLPKKDVQHFVNKEGNKLKKLELFNSSILVVLAFFGFFVNAQLSSAQKIYATKQNAIEIQKFWSEIEKTLDNSVINSGKLGTYTVDFIGAADEVSQYYYLYYIITSTKNTGEQDYKLLSLKASLLSKYSRLVSLDRNNNRHTLTI